jgi:parallel beta-helix repeat protein
MSKVCLCVISFLYFVSIAFAVPAEYVPDQIIVRFAPKSDGSQKTKIEKNQILASDNAGEVKHSFKRVSGLTVVKLPNGLSVMEALSKLKNKKEILYAEPDYIIHTDSTIPTDPCFVYQWGLNNTGQGGGIVGADINAPEAWEIAHDANNIIVAVIDSGIDYNHEDLQDNMFKNLAELNGKTGDDDDGNGYIDDIYGYDFCTWNGKQQDSDPMDDLSHGTHVAGIIGARGNNNLGVTGVCWNVKIMALKFLSSDNHGNTSDAIKCIEYAVDNGANIINASWGGPDPNQALEDAIEAANDANVLVIAAAGNGDRYGNPTNIDTNPHYPASYQGRNIISVMATDNMDQWAEYYTNFGGVSVDLAAPGGEDWYVGQQGRILSTLPVLMGSYGYMEGTSMAAPYVSGACALVWAKYPNLTNLQVKDIILQSADFLESLNGRCATGGRLNLYNALNKINCRPPVHNITQHTWYYTIVAAMNVVKNNDVIEVSPGTYTDERVQITSKNITLKAVDPDPNKTIIVCSSTTSDVVTITSSSASIISGFTIRNGRHGIKLQNASATITGCIIRDNSSDGIYCSGNGAAVVANNMIVDNGSRGIELNSATAPLTIRNNTISNNSSYGIYRYSSTDPNISNCILWDNGYSNLIYSGGNPFAQVNYSCFNPGTSNYSGGTGNKITNPYFVNPVAGDYHLRSDSSCIDTGNPADLYDENDIDSQKRVWAGKGGIAQIDIGSDEFIPGDFNYDRIVTFMDFGILANTWKADIGAPNYNILCNLADGAIIDYKDLRVFAANWLVENGSGGEQSMMQGGFELESVAMQSLETEQLVLDYNYPAIYLTCDTNTPDPNTEVTVYVYSDTPLFCMAATVNVVGDANITTAMGSYDCTDYGWDDGWNWDSYIDPNGWVEFGGVSWDAQAQGVVGYFKFIYYRGRVSISFDTEYSGAYSWDGYSCPEVPFTTEPLIVGRDPNE